MIQNKIEVLNLKSRKTQVPIGYLTLIKNKIHSKFLTNAPEYIPHEDY
jgi:hypothetical protein